MEGIAVFSNLLELQQIDSKIDRLVEDRRTLPELLEHHQAATAAQEAQTAHSEAAARLHEVDRAMTRIDDELAITEQKHRAQERRLFAGGMTAREADHLRMEVRQLGNQVSEMEDEMLGLLEQRDLLDEQEGSAQEKASAARKEEQRLAGLVTRLLADIDAGLSHFRQQRADAVEEVEPGLLRRYQNLRERRGGVVVGEMDGRICGVCHLQMSVAEHEEVIQEAVPQCIHCAAILCL